MVIKASWYEPTGGTNLVEVDIDLFSMPTAVAELVEKVRIAKSSQGGCEILPENIVYEALCDLAAKYAWLVPLEEERTKAEAEATAKALEDAQAEKKRLEDKKVEQTFCGMVK